MPKFPVKSTKTIINKHTNTFIDNIGEFIAQYAVLIFCSAIALLSLYVIPLYINNVDNKTRIAHLWNAIIFLSGWLANVWKNAASKPK